MKTKKAKMPKAGKGMKSKPPPMGKVPPIASKRKAY
jgi:hypothetical protein